MSSAIVQAKLRPIRTCLFCGYKGRWTDTYGTQRCPDCDLEWQVYEAEAAGCTSKGNAP